MIVHEHIMQSKRQRLKCPHLQRHNVHMVLFVQVVQVQGLNSITVVFIAFSAFLIGVCLMGVLWYIHKKTGEYCANSTRCSLGLEYEYNKTCVRYHRMHKLIDALSCATLIAASSQ